MTDTASLLLDDLARRCAEETDKFNRRQSSDPQFCFELLRRALAEGHSDALTRIYQIYERQVIGWVYSHSRFEQTGENADFFAHAALRKFYFALRGAKFARFPSLPQVLAYLKLCVHTEVMQYLRDHRLLSDRPLDSAEGVEQTPDLDTPVLLADIWARIRLVLTDERDRQLARYAFFQDLKPRQIVAATTVWRDEREVTLALYRIRRVLRNDPELRRLLGSADASAAAERGGPANL